MHHCAKDISGRRFSRLVVIRATDKRRGESIVWECVCDCGATTLGAGRDLLSGDKKSCGCLARENLLLSPTSKYRGGQKKMPPEYIAWQQMKRRCLNSNHRYFHCYGGRGIRVCDRWLESYSNFIADMGARPSATHSLDRIDNDGNYEPGNCRWATKQEQSENRRNRVMVTAFGETRSLCEWARLKGIPAQRIKFRLKRGWEPELAMQAPANSHFHKRRTRQIQEPSP